jgi:thiamine monophosphate synthase
LCRGTPRCCKLLFKPRTKSGRNAGTGLGDRYAIGGITTANAAGVVGAGAERLAVVRAIGDAADAERAARALRALLS